MIEDGVLELYGWHKDGALEATRTRWVAVVSGVTDLHSIKLDLKWNVTIEI
jgi:hypothetical protein